MCNISYSNSSDQNVDILNINALKVLNGEVNDFADEYISDLCDLNIKKQYSENVVISKNLKNSTLLLGHSIVAKNFEIIKDENIDVIGVSGAQFDSGAFIEKHLNRGYKDIYIWLGINDVIYHHNKMTTYKDFYKIISKKIDLIYNSKPGDTNLTFFLVSPNVNIDYNYYIKIINDYIKSKYKYIDIGVYPDLDDFHFTHETFKTLFNNCIKSKLS